MKKALLILAVLAVVAAGWFIYFSSESAETKVNSVQAKKENIAIKIELTGEVCPVRSYSVMSTLSGKVSNVFVKEGDAVKRGQSLIRLDDSAALAAMYQNGIGEQAATAAMANNAAAAMANGTSAADAAKAALSEEKAKIALALSQTTGIDYESFNEALAGEIKEQAEAAQSLLNSLVPQDGALPVSNPNTAQAPKVTQALEQDPLYKAIQQELTQRSSMNGKVMKVNVNEGEILAAGTPAMVIADDSALKIRCLVNETDLKRITENQKVNIITRDDVSYSGSILQKSQAAQKVTGGEYTSMEAMGEVYLKPQSNFSEIIGSTVDVEIVLDEAKNVLCLPLDCITGDNYIFVIKNDNTLEKRKIVKGLVDGYNAEVVNGLAEGENVVMSPEGLSDKQKVKIVD